MSTRPFETQWLEGTTLHQAWEEGFDQGWDAAQRARRLAESKQDLWGWWHVSASPVRPPAPQKALPAADTAARKGGR